MLQDAIGDYKKVITLDALTYAVVTEVCARLAGRLSDGVLEAVRSFYAAGEWDMGDATLLLGLGLEHAPITQQEQNLIRSCLGNPENPELLDVPVLAKEPFLGYRFSPDAPAKSPDTKAADIALSAKAIGLGGRRLRRTWHEPVDGGRNPAAWVYVLSVPEGTNELKTCSGLAHTLDRALKEVVVLGSPLQPYQAAALACAHPVEASRS